MLVTFDEIHLTNPLWNALDDLGYFNPTPIQVEAFPVIRSGRDVVGIAQTGTGKTMAYLLPILRDLKFSEQRSPRVIIVVPTRELVLQVVDEIELLTPYITCRVGGIYGGTNINTQKAMVYEGLDILVATPGRLIDLTLSGILRLNSVRKWVIDEVDEMLNLGFLHQIAQISNLLPDRRQNIMFSATLTEEVESLIARSFRDPITLEIARHGSPLEKITQQAYHIPNFNSKVNLLLHLLKNEEELTKVLVFSGTKKLADRLFERVVDKYPEKVGVIHSNKAQKNRFNTVEKFASGETRILIATDIMARGLDIKEVSHVINFDTPAMPADYIHRIGRTGRADKPGTSITFVTEDEMEYQADIEDLMGQALDLLEIPEDVELSKKLTEDEQPQIRMRNYMPQAKKVESSGEAFHEKKAKNKKVNLGGPGKRKPQGLKGGSRKGGRKRKG